MTQTYDLFDSLVRNIFIGTLIYGKPAFAMTLREIDRRPRRGSGSRAALKLHHFADKEIRTRGQTQNLRIVLDGQQRITSIYRAMVGIDAVYIILRNGLDAATIKDLSLEDMIQEVAGEERSDAISVRLSYAYEAERDGLEEEEQNTWFRETLYARHTLDGARADERRAATRIYRRAIAKITDLFKQQKMVAYYLLDMDLEKFCLFFERSNSRGIQLSFIDILAAKLYRGFNLRSKIEEFESAHPDITLNREIIVRAIAYLHGMKRNQGDGRGGIDIDRQFILKNLDVEDFMTHWDEVCALYATSLRYLISQHYILSQSWMPSENMIVPLMLFLRQVQRFDAMTEEQRRFIEYWYWASVFSNRYSTASNEVIILDSNALTQVARGERITVRNYFARLRPMVKEADDLYSYTKRTSVIYRGVLNMLGYAASGLHDWNSTHRIDTSMRLEDHHIYPRAYIDSRPQLDLDQAEAEELRDCVVNRTLIPKGLNVKVGKKPPQTYLAELQAHNSHLADCLGSHLIPSDLITDPTWNEMFKTFLEERAGKIFGLMERYAIAPADEMAQRFGSATSEATSPARNNHKARLRDLLSTGLVQAGERVFVRSHPDHFATIVDGNTVEFEGQRLSINMWGQQITGWISINIYEHICLERTGQTLDSLRGE
jgi:hypothetical protein